MCSMPCSRAGSWSQLCDRLCVRRYAGHLWSRDGAHCGIRPPVERLACLWSRAGRVQALLAKCTFMLGDLAQLAGAQGSFGVGLSSGSSGRGAGLVNRCHPLWQCSTGAHPGCLGDSAAARVQPCQLSPALASVPSPRPPSSRRQLGPIMTVQPRLALPPSPHKSSLLVTTLPLGSFRGSRPPQAQSRSQPRQPVFSLAIPTRLPGGWSSPSQGSARAVPRTDPPLPCLPDSSSLWPYPLDPSSQHVGVGRSCVFRAG